MLFMDMSKQTPMEAEIKVRVKSKFNRITRNPKVGSEPPVKNELSYFNDSRPRAFQFNFILL